MDGRTPLLVCGAGEWLAEVAEVCTGGELLLGGTLCTAEDDSSTNTEADVERTVADGAGWLD